jgi:hypothetical protein
VFSYLHRPVFPALLRALAPGGLLFYETFLVGQQERGHPKNPAFLLEPGELAARVAPLTVLRSREGDYDGKLVASVVASQNGAVNLAGRRTGCSAGGQEIRRRPASVDRLQRRAPRTTAS